ncbi:hypothetical protein CLOSTHATH_07364 [Hungatella hathewayi DSM 13479]|uniref:Uncharacterized protein n=1 Tax=Hungatella hathewayi DSM 13479 TaxID=566550 RepID=D3AUP5_9FIRM|nr:hypothetical protein CLOSTHATH_07364 [Hungatella hathewayi DSM 13479]
MSGGDTESHKPRLTARGNKNPSANYGGKTWKLLILNGNI